MLQPKVPMMSWATPLSNWAVHLAALRLSAAGSAPVNKSARVPQRLRTFAQLLVMQFFILAVAGQLWSWLIPAACIWITRSWVLGATVASYYAYIWSPVGRRVAETDGWWPQPLKRLFLWTLLAEYFQARLVKTADLDPTRSYVLAAAPHGITVISGGITLMTPNAGFNSMFPGITCYGLTLATNFTAIFTREWSLLHGLRSCSRRSCLNLLRRPGNAIILVPGGAAEALVSEPGTCDLLLGRRKGFVRVALLSGASLVPVFLFGETDLFSTKTLEQGSLGRRLQQWCHKLLGSTLPVFWGRGLFTDVGLLPYSKQVTTVVGAPLAVPQVAEDDPSFDRLVDEHHQRFCDAMMELWDAHKDKYAPDRKRDMRFL